MSFVIALVCTVAGLMAGYCLGVFSGYQIGKRSERERTLLHLQAVREGRAMLRETRGK